MDSHRLDPLSLVAGVVFLAFGTTGLLRAAGWIDGSAVLWAAIVVVTVLGLLGVTASLGKLRSAKPD